MLLQAVALPQEDTGQPSSHFLGPEQAPRLQVWWHVLFTRQVRSAEHTSSQGWPGEGGGGIWDGTYWAVAWPAAIWSCTQRCILPALELGLVACRLQWSCVG